MTRLTESRLPESVTAGDLGQAIVSSDDKAALVSYYTSPLCINRKQSYVLFIPDATLRTQVSSIQWQVRLTDADTTDGVWEYTPDDLGDMTLNVTLKDSSDATLRVLSLTQNVVQPNTELENLVALDNQTHPIAGDPATSREIINDILPWLHELAPVATEETLTQLLFGVSYIEALDHNQSARDLLITRLANAINNARTGDFFQQAGAGAGVCRVRPEILAMTLQSGGSPLIPWEEIPTESSARNTALARIQGALAGLSVERHIDIFNLLRFPKANIRMCKNILDALRTRYFGGGSYATVLGNAGNAQRLLDNFKTGPVAAP